MGFSVWIHTNSSHRKFLKPGRKPDTTAVDIQAMVELECFQEKSLREIDFLGREVPKMQKVFVVRAVDDQGVPIPGVFDELKAGRARIGWSYEDKLDLRLIQDKIRQDTPLDADEQDAKSCLGFLTAVERSDYLLYPHQPVRGQFSVVQVDNNYGYSSREGGLDEDFRSFRPCVLKTPQPVDMYDEIVPSKLRQRLGKPRRLSRVTDPAPLFLFLQHLPEVGLQQVSNRSALRRIHGELRNKLPEAIQREFAAADLSRIFCRELFERMGYTPRVQEGPAEAGSDIVIDVDHPLLPREFRVGVQVFSYEGVVEERALGEKLEQLLRGWTNNALHYGVLLTTGHCNEAASAALDVHNETHPNQLVRLIEGNDLADLFLTYFPPSGHR